MAGNAFNGFVYLAVALGLIANVDWSACEACKVCSDSEEEPGSVGAVQVEDVKSSSTFFSSSDEEEVTSATPLV